MHPDGQMENALECLAAPLQRATGERVKVTTLLDNTTTGLEWSKSIKRSAFALQTHKSRELAPFIAAEKSLSSHSSRGIPRLSITGARARPDLNANARMQKNEYAPFGIDWTKMERNLLLTWRDGLEYLYSKPVPVQSGGTVSPSAPPKHHRGNRDSRLKWPPNKTSGCLALIFGPNYSLSA